MKGEIKLANKQSKLKQVGYSHQQLERTFINYSKKIKLYQSKN